MEWTIMLHGLLMLIRFEQQIGEQHSTHSAIAVKILHPLAAAVGSHLQL